jgi:hypothetical protein
MRRAGISVVILLIVPASYDIQAAADPGTLATGSAPAVSSTEDPAMAWRSDGTVEVLSTELDRFFGKETGDYIYVRDEDAALTEIYAVAISPQDTCSAHLGRLRKSSSAVMRAGLFWPMVMSRISDLITSPRDHLSERCARRSQSP